MRCTKGRMLALAFAGTLVFGGCGNGKGDPASEAPPPAQVEHEQDGSVVQVDHPEQFPLATAACAQFQIGVGCDGSCELRMFRGTCRSSRWPPAASWIFTRVWAIRCKRASCC